MKTLPIDNLFGRRSIRRYTGQEVTEAQVELLLQAAMAAPSAGNRQPWHWLVIRDQAMREALAATHPYAGMLPQAAVCIVPCGEPARSFPDRSDYWIQDLSAATENLLLAAHGLGLGAVWCGVYPVAERVDAARELLGIPEGVIPLCFVAIGYPAESKEPRTQYNVQRVHRERW